MPHTKTAIEIPCLPVADIELPRAVEKLYDLAYNLWWAWSPPARLLFQAIDRDAWQIYRNPVQVLINVEPTHWEPLLENEAFMAGYREVMDAFESYRNGPRERWFERAVPYHTGGPVAYFSMEYGLHQSLALYSGGLGVLAGDHLKTASDLGLPFVGVGLLYRRGYFHQTVDAEGRQQHSYHNYDFSRLPIRPAATRTGREVFVSVPLPGREVHVKVWVAEVGRVPLLLLDTDHPKNDPADRPISGMLYVAGREMRLIQELVLGVGGVRALEALGIEPSVWHVNEGHCALLQLERLHRALADGAGDIDKALVAISRDVVFTTHTPVPAGNEAFDRTLAEKYLAPWAGPRGLTVDRLVALGDAGQGEENFNLTALALRTSRSANAVSKINADVTSKMWAHLLPTKRGKKQAILPITNGIHSATWIGREMQALFTRALGANWQERLLEADAWSALGSLPDEDVWAAHLTQKHRLARFARSRSRELFARHGRSPDELREVDTLFDPEALTIGFARRFATYKRAKLVFSDLARLKALLCAEGRPVQMIFAGKAHPADLPGQELIRQIFELSESADLRGKVFFIEDYDMRVGRQLVQGVDVWLNTPRPPMEASGTSGQKAAINGALNLSILDGWWPEGFDGKNGWAIQPSTPETGDEESQDRADSEALYGLLENEVVPAYYDRDDVGLPRAWIARMKDAIATITPQFSSARMLRDYVEKAYFPK